MWLVEAPGHPEQCLWDVRVTPLAPTFLSRLRSCLSALCPPVAASLSGNDLPRVNLSVANTILLTLVDSGSSHDFVSETTIRQLGLTLRPCDWSHVTLADGGKRYWVRVTLRASAGPLRLQLRASVCLN